MDRDKLITRLIAGEALNEVESAFLKENTEDAPEAGPAVAKRMVPAFVVKQDDTIETIDTDTPVVDGDFSIPSVLKPFESKRSKGMKNAVKACKLDGRKSPDGEIIDEIKELDKADQPKARRAETKKKKHRMHLAQLSGLRCKYGTPYSERNQKDDGWVIGGLGHWYPTFIRDTDLAQVKTFLSQVS